MNPNNNQHFFDYEMGRLAPEDVQSFESRLKNEAGFAKAFEQFRLSHEIAVIEAVEEERKQEAKALYQKWEAKLEATVGKTAVVEDQDEGAKLRPIYRYAGIAATVLLLLFTGNFVINNYQDSTPTNYANYGTVIMDEVYQKAPINTDRGGDVDEDAWIAARSAYAEDAPATVVELLATLQNRSVGENYLLAHAYFEVGNYRESQQLFDNIAKTTSSLSTDAEWKAILALFSQADDTAKGEREAIISEGKERITKLLKIVPAYEQKATALLDKMKLE